MQPSASLPAHSAISEFSVERAWRSDQRSPVRWLFSHIWRYKIYILGILIGALGNAGGAAIMPVLVGQAFNAVIAQPPAFAALGQIAILIVFSQVVRAILQLGRNFSSEIIGQRLSATRATSYTPA